MSPTARGSSRGGDELIVELLNEALSAELAAINQYFVHAKLCESWGWRALAAKFREESIEEMIDAEKLMDRIIFLHGLPNMQRIAKVNVGETVPEQLTLDLQVEIDAVARYRCGVALCTEHGDVGTRELLEQLLVGEEEHVDWIETQLTMITDIGIERYLQAHIVA